MTAAPSDLWVVTAHFNPAGYRARSVNLNRFLYRLDAATPNWRVIECVPTGQPFELHESRNVMHVHSDTVLWHKERLLNLVSASLPASCTKVICTDADLLFSNPGWLEESSRLLDEYPVIQPFETCVHLPGGHTTYRGEGVRLSSFASVYARDPDAYKKGDYYAHGHTGFAWGFRRELLEMVGLYEPHPLGGADELMAHAFVGDLDSPCINGAVGSGAACRRHFDRWSQRMRPMTQGRVGFARGEVWHLWHGHRADRQYCERIKLLADFGFDPAEHLRVSTGGCREWHNPPEGLPEAVKRYFRDRREDAVHDPSRDVWPASLQPKKRFAVRR